MGGWVGGWEEGRTEIKLAFPQEFFVGRVGPGLVNVVLVRLCG